MGQCPLCVGCTQAGVKVMRMSFCRIDGDVASAQDRQAQVKRFQTSDDIPVFLLTSQVMMCMHVRFKARGSERRPVRLHQQRAALSSSQGGARALTLHVT